MNLKNTTIIGNAILVLVLLFSTLRPTPDESCSSEESPRVMVEPDTDLPLSHYEVGERVDLTEEPDHECHDGGVVSPVIRTALITVIGATLILLSSLSLYIKVSQCRCIALA